VKSISKCFLIALTRQSALGTTAKLLISPQRGSRERVFACSSLQSRGLGGQILPCLLIVLGHVLKLSAIVPQDGAPAAINSAGSIWAPLQIKDSPSTQDIRLAALFDQPLRPVREPNADENQALL